MLVFMRLRRWGHDELRWVVHILWLLLRSFTKYPWVQLRGLLDMFELPEPDAAPDAEPDDAAPDVISADGDPSTDARGMFALRGRS